MRKTSHDGGDNTSITSGIENEIKKSCPGILKSTKSSIKRKVQNLSTESDDTANEPLLQKNKERIEIEKQSAKFLLSKTNTDFANPKNNDKVKLLADDKITNPSITDVVGITEGASHSLKGVKHDTNLLLSKAPIHNYINTNVLNNSGGLKDTVIAKAQILVEVDSSKPSGYSPSPLIFTTAKIHTDGKMHQMEPVQVTPVPIISTIEGGVVKSGTKGNEIEKKQEVLIKSPPVSKAPIFAVPEKRLNNKDNADKISTTLCSIEAQVSNNSKIISDESITINQAQGVKLVETPINIHGRQDSNSVNKNLTKIFPVLCNNSAIDKNNTDINKNIQSETRLYGEKKIQLNEFSKEIGKERGNPQKSGENSSSNSGSDFKEEKTHPHSITNEKKIMPAIGDNKSNTILVTSTSLTDKSKPSSTSSSSNKPSLKETTCNKTNNTNVVKNLGAFHNIEAANSTISTEKSISKTIAPCPIQAMTRTTKNSIKKTLVKENEDIAKIANTVVSTEGSSTSKILISDNTVCKINSSLPVITNLTKTNKLDKEPTKSKEKDSVTQIKTYDSKTSSISNDTQSIKSSIVHSTSVSPQIVSSSTVEKVLTTAITKTTSAGVSTSNATGTTKLSSIISSTTTTDALKHKSNNVSVVSSISKASTLSTKSSSLSTSSTTTGKQATTAKLASPSTVKTISSVPTVKSSVVSNTSRDKVNIKNVASPVSKQTSSTTNVTDATSSATYKPLAIKNTGTVTDSPSAKVVPTTSVKPTAVSSHRSNMKLNENSKEKKNTKI